MSWRVIVAFSYLVLMFGLAALIALGTVHEESSFGLGILLGALGGSLKDVIELLKQEKLSA